MKKSDITIFTDGSSRGNPGPGGWGAIVIHEDNVRELGGHKSDTTNNRMELTAVIQALEFLSQLKNQKHPLPIVVNTDSSYVQNGATLWIHGWKKNNWKTKAHSDVLNKDLWEMYLNESNNKNITWNLLKGHSGNPGNERCDEIATAYADSDYPELYSGAHSEYGVDVFQVDQLLNQKKKKLDAYSKSKPYSYVSSIKGVIQTHASWKECEERVRGQKGALFKKSFSVQDENSIIEQWKGLLHS